MSIKSYQINDPEDPKIGIENIQSLENFWIDVQNPNNDEEKAIETRFGIDIISEYEARTLEDSSRFYIEKNNIYLGISIPARKQNTSESQIGHRRSFLSFVLTPKTLITIHETPLRALEVGKSRSSTRLVGAKSAQDTLLIILEAIIERQADFLAKIGLELDSVSLPQISSRQIIKGEARIIKLGHLGAQLALCRDCLSDIGRAINYLIQVSGERGIDAKKLRGLAVDILTLQRQCEAQSNDLTFVLDATLGLIGARQSKALNFMAVVTLLFAPATLISSIFGMNFQNWHFLSNPIGLLVAISSMALSALFVLFIAKYAKLF